ncbi:hypothetical protein N483_07710 [Pseudoalteromonas luteoviolacea NCIMB 1944]|nr:hypothetical protein N483_07710 [Pseudoalteromonas luteoviolacea NCIMB 1944]
MFKKHSKEEFYLIEFYYFIFLHRCDFLALLEKRSFQQVHI